MSGMCRELYDHRQWLWTFLEVEGVELTNNASERALRHPVIWRKLSFGTQSAAGSRFVETMLTRLPRPDTIEEADDPKLGTRRPVASHQRAMNHKGPVNAVAEFHRLARPDFSPSW
jgi:Transposase IS66 family